MPYLFHWQVMGLEANCAAETGQRTNMRQRRDKTAPNLLLDIDATSAQKVCEIHRVMVEELEKSIMGKIACISSCLHAWRTQAMEQRGMRYFEEELAKQKQTCHRVV